MNNSVVTHNAHTEERKGQHFLKAAIYRRALSFWDLINMSEIEIFMFLCAFLWQSWSTVVCSRCGLSSNHYYYSDRRRWRCKNPACNNYFSVLSGTVFSDTKLSLKKILCMLGLFAGSENGIAHNMMSRLIDVQTKTAQAFIGKIREALIKTANHTKLSGIVHMDGGHFGGKPRHGCTRRVPLKTIKQHVESMLVRKTMRPIKTKIANQERKSTNRRVLFTLRQVVPVRGVGATRTIVAVADGETSDIALSLALKYIEPGTIVMTDEGNAFSEFSKYFDHRTVEHAWRFQEEDGTNNNQAESFFSRVRRYEYGVSHRVEPKYFFDIATEMAWREDSRHQTYQEKIFSLLDAVFASHRSQYWTGYWQGYNRPGELIWNTATERSTVRKLRG